jgi:hypothetical protein
VTREIADVPARRIVQFKAGKTMKEMVAVKGGEKSASGGGRSKTSTSG